MTDRILVTYASKHGSTREVAERIARRLDSDALAIDLRPASDVRDVSDYDGVILGAALYTGRMIVDARRFLRRHHGALARRPFAIFAMGPLTTSEHDVAGATKQLDAGLEKLPDLHPIATAVFGGVVDPSQLRFPFNRMKASDARDWDAVDAWADELGRLLRARQFAATG